MWTRVILLAMLSNSITGLDDLRIKIIDINNANHIRAEFYPREIIDSLAIGTANCLEWKSPCSLNQDLKVFIGADRNNTCFTNVAGIGCAQRYEVHFTVVYTHYSLLITMTRTGNGRQLNLIATCRNGTKAVLDNVGQSSQTVQLRWTTARPLSSPKYTFEQLMDNIVVLKTNWTDNWESSIRCANLPPTQTTSTVTSTMTHTTSSVKVNTTQYNRYNTNESSCTDCTTSSADVGNSTIHASNTDDNQNYLLYIIIPSCLSALILLFVLAAIWIYQRRKSNLKSSSQKKPEKVTNELNIDQSSNIYNDPTYDHLRDRVQVERCDSTYEMHDIPIYSQSQRNTDSTQGGPNTTENQSDNSNMYSAIHKVNSVHLTSANHRDNPEISDLYANDTFGAAAMLPATHFGHETTTPNGDVYAEVVKVKMGRSD